MRTAKAVLLGALVGLWASWTIKAAAVPSVGASLAPAVGVALGAPGACLVSLWAYYGFPLAPWLRRFLAPTCAVTVGALTFYGALFAFADRIADPNLRGSFAIAAFAGAVLSGWGICEAVEGKRR